MSLDASKIKTITWKASNFRKMHNLIFLKIYKSDQRKPSKLNICEDLDYLPEELRFFGWEEYPLPYVPLHFCAENLIILEMPNSNLRQLCNGYLPFPNLKEILLSDSKYLTTLRDLSHAPKIELVPLNGCVNLAQIHTSTVPGKHVQLCIDDIGPVQINFGGTIKGTSSGLMFVYNYLDIRKLSLNKVTMKLFVRGKIMSGVRFRHVVMPLADISELRFGIQNLASLLPFIRKLHWLDSPIEFGNDFKQHYSYDPYYAYHNHRLGPDFRLAMMVRGDKGEMINDNEKEMTNDYQAVAAAAATTMTLMEDEEEDELMEYCGSNSVILTRVPNSMTRWSLLRHLTLNKSDIIGINEGCSNINAQVSSMLRSLVALSNHDYGKRIQPHLDVKLSLDIAAYALRDYGFYIRYNVDINKQRTSPYLFGSLWFNCCVNNYRSLDCNYDFKVEYEDWS